MFTFGEEGGVVAGKGTERCLGPLECHVLLVILRGGSTDGFTLR